MTDMITNTNVFTYLGVSSPTAGQTAMMTVVRKGVEGSVRNFVAWPVTEDSYIFVMPRAGVAYYNNLRTSQLYGSDIHVGKSRIQLPVPYVSEITTIHENYNAHGGEVTDDFSDDFLLTAGTDYFLDAEGGWGTGRSFSESGGVFRENACWSSIPGTIRVECTAGFDSSDFDDGVATPLKQWLISKVADSFMANARKTAMTFSSGSAGLIKSEKLGDYAVTYADVFASGSEGSGRGLTKDDEAFLSDYMFCAVSV